MNASGHNAANSGHKLSVARNANDASRGSDHVDHIAFAATDHADLERWMRYLEELSVEHGGIIDAHYGSALSFKDPDGIALEFFAPPASQ